ncbi:unnamed protein product [Kuraishia capsulata CBS 1993]|uniref:Mitochondrial inner membrane protease subunit 2 n=1 Tax=Kuraishia capsulata CBS 1993 TaxID=1382522 RepID=W6MJJ1_9ASCO|nr:uncharacterized protein KUCA_T00000578001 [Kuraishia capsulata CBS 1993]CDK24612.1 unnamed protein product [Kuraishia capsulata CBS 1993]
MFSGASAELLRKSLRRSWLFITWIPVVYTFNEHVCYIGKIEGSSMRPTFNPAVNSSDYVLLWKWNIRDPENLNYNDVVLLKSPMNPQKVFAKRIKGVQGDVIMTRYPYPREKCTVPTSHLWVEGDNIHSIDSNTFGPISTGLVVGKATRIIYPFSRWGEIPEGGRECRLSRLSEYA